MPLPPPIAPLHLLTEAAAGYWPTRRNSNARFAKEVEWIARSGNCPCDTPVMRFQNIIVRLANRTSCDFIALQPRRHCDRMRLRGSLCRSTALSSCSLNSLTQLQSFSALWPRLQDASYTGARIKLTSTSCLEVVGAAPYRATTIVRLHVEVARPHSTAAATGGHDHRTSASKRLTPNRPDSDLACGA